MPAEDYLCSLQIFEESSTGPRRSTHIALRDEGIGIRSHLIGTVYFARPGHYLLALTGTPKYVGAMASFFSTVRATVR